MQKTPEAKLVRQNVPFVKRLYPELPSSELDSLRELTQQLHLSASQGEILRIRAKWYVTHAGLLRIALRRKCQGIRTVLQDRHCNPASNRWVFRATVYKSPRSRGFVGYGDADPSNVSPLVQGAEMRVAETRAVNRALRKAYGIGLCSMEELGWTLRHSDPDPTSLNGFPVSGSANHQRPSSTGNNGHQNGQQPRLRDRLCLLIRQHKLDAVLVKAFAADYCGTPALRDASRESIEAFINDLAERATKGHAAPLCHLNSYAKPQEVNL